MKKTKVIKEKCISCGLCVAMAEEVFELDDEGLAYNKLGDANPIDENLIDDVKEAKESCPTDAIIVTNS